MSSMAGRRVLVTGAGGAIGRETSLTLARAGAAVAVVDLSRESADETTTMITAAGGVAVSVVADVAAEDSVREAVGVAADALGGLDCLVNNAGIMPHQDESFLDADSDVWRLIWDINLMGTTYCAKHVVPYLMKAGGGSVVNMSSFLAVMGCTAPQDAYAASKGAIMSLTTSMAVQLGRHGIRVNALAPGPIMTAHVEKFFPDAEARNRRLARVPLGRFGTAADAAELIAFLASDAASWITGQVVELDGGISVNYL